MKAIVYVEGKSTSPFVEGASGIECIKSETLESLPAAVYEEIELVDVLEFDKNPQILSVVLQKLRHGATLRIVGTDALQVIRESEGGRVDMKKASEQLLNGRLRMTSAHDLKSELSSMEMEVTALSISGFRYLVEARRK